jgi:hypothetical protein
MPARPPAARWSPRVVGLAVLVLAATVFGGWQAVVLASQRHDPRALRIGGATYTVTHVEQVNGLSDVDVGGMTHGIQGFVADDQLMIRVSLTVSSGDAPASYQPQLLQAFRSGSRQGVAPAGGSLPGGKLPAHARIEGVLSYLVPRDGAQFALGVANGTQQVPLLRVSGPTGGTPAPAHQGTSHS